MANDKPATGARTTIGDIAPKLAEISLEEGLLPTVSFYRARRRQEMRASSKQRIA